MLKPPAVTMGTTEYFATCGDNLNERGGGDGASSFFMGPALFSTDPAILGKATSGGLGSHMDMLHNTPMCRGIAHEKANIFWVFNAMDHSLDKYNFNEDHGPGNDDHSDGEIYRYAMGKVKGVTGTDGTPSHVFFDAEDSFLYVADTGNARIVKLDTTKGKKGGELERQNEPLKDQAVMLDTDVEEVEPPGTLEKPSGIEVYKGNIYVTDAATSTFHVFDKTGKELRKLETGLPAGSLAGMAFSSTGKLYFTDKVAGKVLRIDRL
jgi:DNA-binding beta-propeller fold protein YncE